MKINIVATLVVDTNPALSKITLNVNEVTALTKGIAWHNTPKIKTQLILQRYIQYLQHHHLWSANDFQCFC